MLTGVLRAAWLFRRGQRLAAQGHFDEAIETFGQAQVLRPRAAGIYLHQALALAETSRLPEAVLALQQAMAIQPGNPVLPLFLGCIYADHADYTHAAHWCARALALNPANGHALALQALIEMASGQLQQGSERLQQPLPLPVSPLQRVVLWCSRSRVPSLLPAGRCGHAGARAAARGSISAPACGAGAYARSTITRYLGALHASGTVATDC